MFGVVVHANIAAMILKGDYVDELTEWQKIAIAFMVCFLTVALFVTIDTRLPAWYDGVVSDHSVDSDYSDLGISGVHLCGIQF